MERMDEGKQHGEQEDEVAELSPGQNDDTPSPQVGSPKVDSDLNDSPPQVMEEGEREEEEEGEKEEGGQGEGEGEEGKKKAEGQKEEDPCTRSEGVVHFVLSDLSNLDSRLSNPVIIRNVPWRILVMGREVKTAQEVTKSLGVFVQCNPLAPESTSWHVWAKATITLVNHANITKSFAREISHCFCQRENDWGYSNFIGLKDAIDPVNGYLKDESLTLEAHVVADPPHGIQWDSRKHTGYVGLKNQGATCYMNSLLQTLYCLPKLRKAVYQMPTETDDQTKSVPLALQRLFYELQHSDKPVGTKKLTKSFGWDTMDIFMQHDIQELCRVLLDNIENKMKNTVVEGTIPGLFEGKMESYIRCSHVEYESARVETFFDIQLNIKGKKDVNASFKDYVAVETLDGENKYDASDFGLQEAKKGVIFIKLPPVLHLHLMRFQYDPIMDTNTKINDRYEFPVDLNLDQFLKRKEDTPANYTLHAVLVHSGDNYGGHYVAYLNSKRDGNWLKFDDDIVSKCSVKDAVDQNFGGSEDTLGIRNCTNAYMLVYVRDSCIDDVLQEVKEGDISEELVKKFDAEKRLEQQRRKERNEAHLFMSVEVYQEDDFQAHQRADLIDFDEVKGGYIKCLKTTTYPEFHQTLSTVMGYPPNCVRVWPFERRSNGTTRPGYLEKLDNPKITLFQHAEQRNIWRVFVETLPADSKTNILTPYNFQQEVLLFYKFYNPTTRTISFVGHSVENIERKFRDLFPALRKAASLHPDVPLLIFEEIKANMVEKIDPDIKIGQLDEFRDGDIICFQREDIHHERLTLSTVADYFRELYNRIVVTFIDKSQPGDTGVALTLNQRMTYTMMAKEVATVLGTDLYHLQFFKPQGAHQDVPIRSNIEGNVRDFVSSRHRYEDPYTILYQKLSIPVQEFETKKCFRCYFVNDKLREEKELDLYVDKNGTVLDLLREAYKDIEMVLTSDSGSRILRLVEILGHRVVEIHDYDKPVSELQTQKIYRIEEVRKEEVELDDDEAFLPIAHFHKAPGNTFGTPFIIVVKNGERISSVIEKIRSRVDVSDKEFDKWRFAIVQAIQVLKYFSEEEDDPILFNHFYLNPARGITFPRMGTPWLGLEHVNKNPKRVRYTVEKAIKIHN